VRGDIAVTSEKSDSGLKRLVTSGMGVLSIRVPSDFVLARDVCSYGYFMLAPNQWDVQRQVLRRVLSVREGTVNSKPVAVEIGQRGTTLRVTLSREVSGEEREVVRAQIARMLRLDESAERIAAFHARDPRFTKSGRGRIFRSPTLFEDVVKTVTSCNVQWPGTITMNRRLCEVLGSSIKVDGVKLYAFPTAAQMAKARATTLRSRCRVGYRDERLVELARLFTLPVRKGGIDQAWLQDAATPDEQLFKALVKLPGIGPYAAANIMQLLGRYGRLPLDTEAARHGREVLGVKGTTASVMRQVREHFAPFGEDAFRSYWFEMWCVYEAKRGPAWEWVK
jgi:3-methyladenine DNA glycosylase/8-oxoguanine DNA glycosylase